MDVVGGGRSILRLFDDTFSLSNAKLQFSFSQSGPPDCKSRVHPFHSGRGGQTCFLRLPRYHGVGGLEQRELIQSSGDQRPEIKGEVSLVLCGGSEGVSAACCSPCFSERPAAPRVPWLQGITPGSGPTSTGCSPRVSLCLRLRSHLLIRTPNIRLRAPPDPM